MDRITQSIVQEFVTDNDFSKFSSSAQFELFASSLCVPRHLGESFDPTDIVVGEGGDTGIDGIAIIVNGQLVIDVESIADLVQTNNYLETTFIFVQAERTAGFSTAKVSQFGYGVADFFSHTPTMRRSEKISNAAEIMTSIYRHASKFTRGRPACRMYYVTTGRWSGDRDLLARGKSVEDDLTREQLLGAVDFHFVDAGLLQTMYRQSKNSISREFTFSERTTIPEIPGVNEAYLGLIPAPEFVSLLKDETGDIVKSLFYDNVRDWQGDNPVNSEMKKTLQSPDLRIRFALMNNGVTIIAKTLRPTGDRFYIEDYQIVNGCQTSNVLFNERANLDDKIMVPLRLISTQDEGVINSIIQATNRQTEVKAEQLLALSDFQKRLEKYFETFSGTQSLHYERRSRQFAGASFEKTRIVTPSNLIKAFAAIFLEEPHRTTRNYKSLLDNAGKTIFVADHVLEPYYLSAVMLYQLEFLFRSQALAPLYKAARFQILMVARMLLSKDAPPRMNSHEMSRFCDEALKYWWTPRALALLKAAAVTVGQVAKGDLHRDHIRTQPFTEDLRSAARKSRFKVIR